MSVADTIDRALACPESARPGRLGAPAAHAGVAFATHGALTLVDLRGDPQDPAFLTSARAALGAGLPLTPNTTAAGANCEVLWLGPDEWLLVGAAPTPIDERLPIEHGFLTDVSHGRAAWRISGPRTLDLLAKGCSLDLHARVFPSGSCAQTALAHVGVLLHRRDIATFELYCARSYAQHLWHWLTEAAGEFGYDVAAPVGG
jgi:sarcosine oxidase subunit gamma